MIARSFAICFATDYEITEAENGEQALAAVTKQRPDLILMDIQLPIMDGYEATRRIKADPALKSIPIIAVTVSTFRSESDSTWAMSASAWQWCQYPVLKTCTQ